MGQAAPGAAGSHQITVLADRGSYNREQVLDMTVRASCPACRWSIHPPMASVGCCEDEAPRK